MLSHPMIVHRYARCTRCKNKIERASMFVGVLPVVEVELIECPSCGNVWEGKFEYEGETTSIYEI